MKVDFLVILFILCASYVITYVVDLRHVIARKVHKYDSVVISHDLDTKKEVFQQSTRKAFLFRNSFTSAPTTSAAVPTATRRKRLTKKRETLPLPSEITTSPPPPRKKTHPPVSSKKEAIQVPEIDNYFPTRRRAIKHFSFSRKEISERCTPSSNGDLSCPDITMVTQLTTSRLLFLKSILEKWSGPISVALALTHAELSLYSKSPSRIIPFSLPSRVILTPFEIDDRKPFPVNRLRNVAIRACQTSHFFYNDIDFMPSDGLYERLMQIPESFLNADMQAIIIPAFEIYPKLKVDRRTFRNEWGRIKPYIPGNKTALAACMNTKKKDCIIFRDKSHLHEYLIRDWFTAPSTTLLYDIPCLRGDRQEPYLLVKKSSKLPLYDERFTGYGWNKVQWIEHLRMKGYRFFVFEQGFIVHCPHPMSDSQRMFGARMGSVQNVWKTFLSELKKSRSEQPQFPRC